MPFKCLAALRIQLIQSRMVYTRRLKIHSRKRITFLYASFCSVVLISAYQVFNLSKIVALLEIIDSRGSEQNSSYRDLTLSWWKIYSAWIEKYPGSLIIVSIFLYISLCCFLCSGYVLLHVSKTSKNRCHIHVLFLEYLN